MSVYLIGENASGRAVRLCTCVAIIIVAERAHIAKFQHKTTWIISCFDQCGDRSTLGNAFSLFKTFTATKIN